MPARNSPGFTMLEILVVVLIIGMLTAYMATNMIQRADQAKVSLATTQIRQLEQALELYKLDNGRYPTADQGLEALVRAPGMEPLPRRYPPGGYVKLDAIQDPWSTQFQYMRPGDHNGHSFDLFSYGPDGLEGGEGEDADIVNWDTETLL